MKNAFFIKAFSMIALVSALAFCWLLISRDEPPKYLPGTLLALMFIVQIGMLTGKSLDDHEKRISELERKTVSLRSPEVRAPADPPHPTLEPIASSSRGRSDRPER